MAGSGLIAIKRRIKSITSTKKITKAMGLVATAKLRKSKEKLYANEKYYEVLSESIDEILSNHTGFNIYKNGNSSKKKLYIILTSDSGLCGGFNGNILNRAVEEIQKDKENSLSIVVGEKGSAFFKRVKLSTIDEVLDISDLPTLRELKGVVTKALHLYEKGEVGQIFIVYAKFLTSIKQEVQIEKLLPLNYNQEEEDTYKDKDYIKFEPDADSVLNNALLLYIKEKVLNSMLHSKTSELSARMTAMDGATKNANELLEKLKLQYNRMRQGAITQEISEIVGGAEAQK